MATKFHAIRVKSPDELRHVIEHITHEAYRARSQWDTLVALNNAFDEYATEFNATPAL